MYRYDIIDQQTDRSQKTLYSALEKYASADTIKSVCLEGYDAGELTKLAGDEFAFPEFRAFPVNTMESTILSKIYFDYQKDEGFHNKLAAYIPRVEDRIASFLNLFNVPASILEKKASDSEKDGLEKSAEEFSPQYLVPSKKLCKVANKMDLHIAAKLFDNHFDQLDIPTRIEFSQNYVKISSEIKYSNFSTNIAKYAAELDTNLSNTKRYLELRAAAAHRSNLVKAGEEYIKLAKQLDGVDFDETTKEELQKLAELIYSIDKDYGFENSKKMPCAYTVVFNKLADNDPAMAMSAQDNIAAKTMSKADIIGRYGVAALSNVENEDGTINPERVAELNKLHTIFKSAPNSTPQVPGVTPAGATGAPGALGAAQSPTI